MCWLDLPGKWEKRFQNLSVNQGRHLSLELFPSRAENQALGYCRIVVSIFFFLDILKKCFISQECGIEINIWFLNH